VSKLTFHHLRTKLLVSLLAVVFSLTAAVLVVVQARMRRHVREDLVSTLRAESAVYEDLVAARREQTQQSTAIIVDQASLKALISTDDPLTVQDGSKAILESSRADLLILESASGEILAFHARADSAAIPALAGMLQVSVGKQDWWFADGHLYDVSLAAIVAGSGPNKRLLGRMALGRDVSPQSVLRSRAFGRSAFVFERNGKVLLSSLNPDAAKEFENLLAKRNGKPRSISDITLAGESYLADFVDLSGDHPVRLYCLESFDQATSFLGTLNRMLMIVAAVALIAGALLAFLLSRQITRPLERLALGTERLKQGDFDFEIPIQGTDEVAELTRAFGEMRQSLQQSRESLLRSARLEAVGRLAGGVAHDFNNLVMIIQGYSDLLLDQATPEAIGHIEEIKKAGERASGLTRQLLAFSRKQVLEPQVLDPNQVVRGMLKMLRILIGEDIELVTHFSEQAGRIKADAGQLEQVVMNLAVNARDAMPGGGKLILETKPCYLDDQYAASHSEVTPGRYLLLAVTDTGCGMPEETLAHIFEPFFTTKAAGKGTGLGLATVYGIVKQSHGHISVYSEVGRGTTFKVYVPSLESSVPLATPTRTSMVLKGEGTILLVEDEAALRLLAAESLKRLGYTVLSAGDGIEALAVAEQHSSRIDVVVTDIVMPRMGGPELVERLRLKQDGLGVVFMSGYTEAAALENASIARGATLLNKPFSSELLARKVSEVVQGAKVNAKAKDYWVSLR
jgi:signal transduction histidine kinase/ActR/RegA family two-component response regulator